VPVKKTALLFQITPEGFPSGFFVSGTGGLLRTEKRSQAGTSVKVPSFFPLMALVLPVQFRLYQ
jgi:hypothetical protein